MYRSALSRPLSTLTISALSFNLRQIVAVDHGQAFMKDAWLPERRKGAREGGRARGRYTPRLFGTTPCPECLSCRRYVGRLRWREQ